jgi:predicted O-linked N-acetylglucosamine transferase (SPINDLY family)
LGESGNLANSYIPFMSTIREALGGRTVILEIMPFLKYQEYMTYMEEGDLTLDTFHFGGCNVAADSLFIRKPFVAWQGDKWYNRISSAMLRRAGLDELICNSESEYLDTSLRLIHDDRWRDDLTARLQKTDLHGTVFGDAEASSFRRAVEYLLANHDRLKTEHGRKPLRIL